MAAFGGSSLTGAVLFSAGRFSEALSEYDSHGNGGDDDVPLGGENKHAAMPTSTKALYAACNRAAAKLELEMYRSCLRDCDEAIKMDSFCLRAHILKGNTWRSYSFYWN